MAFGPILPGEFHVHIYIARASLRTTHYYHNLAIEYNRQIMTVISPARLLFSYCTLSMSDEVLICGNAFFICGSSAVSIFSGTALICGSARKIIVQSDEICVHLCLNLLCSPCIIDSIDTINSPKNNEQNSYRKSIFSLLSISLDLQLFGIDLWKCGKNGKWR